MFNKKILGGEIWPSLTCFHEFFPYTSDDRNMVHLSCKHENGWIYIVAQQLCGGVMQIEGRNRRGCSNARGLKRWCLQDCSLMFSKDEHFITAISFRFKIFLHIICLTWCVGTAWRQPCSLRRHLWHRWNLLQCCHRWGQSFGKKVGEDMWLCVGWEGLWLCCPVPAFLLCLSLETMADPEFPSCHLCPQTKQSLPPQSHRFTLKQKHTMRYN